MCLEIEYMSFVDLTLTSEPLTLDLFANNQRDKRIKLVEYLEKLGEKLHENSKLGFKSIME